MGISSIASIGWNYVKRAGKLYPDFVLGTGNEKFTKAMQETIKNRKLNNQSYFESVWSGIKNGTLKAEEHNALMQKRYGGFWQSTWAALKTFPDKVAQGWRVGGMLADKAGKTGLSKFWAQFKGSMSGIGKRMPLIGTLLIGITELPNIFSAFKDEGLIGGIKETAKAGLRLGAGMAGAAIGQALIPIPVVGSLVGYAVGDWLMSKFTGKSHSEQAAPGERHHCMLFRKNSHSPDNSNLFHCHGRRNRDRSLPKDYLAMYSARHSRPHRYRKHRSHSQGLPCACIPY